jgi:sigma-B regulation protein RsbU (phosphoserine phosphatase)
MGTDEAPRVGTFRTLRARLLTWILLVAVPIYAGATYLSYQTTAQRLEADAIQEADQLAERMVATMDSVVRPIEAGIRTVAFQLEEVDPPRAGYVKRIRGILAAWPDIYGSTIAVEPTGAGAPQGAFAPYLFRGRSGDIGYSDLAKESYGYRDLPWYRVAAGSLQPAWSSPYFDAGGGETWMITYSVPFFRRLAQGRRELAGIVTADLDLEWVRRNAAASPLESISMGWLYPAQPEVEFIAAVGNSASRMAIVDPRFDPAAMRRAGENMLARDVTFAHLPRTVSDEAGYLAIRNLSTTGWRLALVIPREQLLAEARQLLNRQIVLGVVGLLLLIIAVSLVAAGITRPIRALAAAVGNAGEDNLDIQLPPRPALDEVGVLTAALQRLRESLQRHIQLRASTLAAAARMDHELEVSAQIQQSMLPHGQSLRALPATVELAVALQPARQVGGDLYDFFLLHDGKVLFAVGDVSDKGVPAALFMARLSALMRVLGSANHGPARLLEEINGRLAESNDACMFVTVGCGLLDPQTGEYSYASAGHDPPVLRRMEGGTSLVTAQNGPAIGIETTVQYEQQEGVLAPGDTLILFTDGVTEAESADGALLGLDRLLTLVGEAPDGAPQTLISRIVEQVGSHAAGFHATDDMTAMAIRFQPVGVAAHVDPQGARWTIDVEPSPAGVAHAQRQLSGILRARGTAPARLHDVELVAEEWLTNVIRAAGNDPACRISVDLTLGETLFAVTFRDTGPAFNPLQAAAPDLDAPIADRPIGGLGIHLVQQIADDCEYARVDDCNVLRVRFKGE